MMDILVIATLICIAAILLLVELFLIPGISIAGILSGICVCYANFYAFSHLGTWGGVITLGVSVVCFMRSKTLGKIALKENITSTIGRRAEESIQVGDTGVTTTRLTLIGQAEINGVLVEVKSADGFLNEKTPVVVSRIVDGVIMVTEKK